MFIENQISEIYVDFAEIFDTIRVNDYSDKQRNEMMQLFEGQTIKKCLDFIFSSVKFVKGIASVTDLVFNVVQEEKLTNFVTKETFLEIFDKAVNLYEGTYNYRLHEDGDTAFNDNLERVDEIRELKKKYDDLKRESEVLLQEIDEKNSNLVETENLYIKLKYYYYKLTDQWETLNEENIILKQKVSGFTVQNQLDEESRREINHSFVEEINNLKKIVNEKEAQISQLLVEQTLSSESTELLKSEVKLKNCLLEEVKRESEDRLKHNVAPVDYPMQTQAVVIDECKSCKCNEVNENLGTQVENDLGHNDVLKLVIDKRNSSADDLNVFPFDVEAEFIGDEIKFSSTRKSLGEELLGAWTVLSDDDKLEHDDPMELYQEFFENPTFAKNHWKLDNKSFFMDSGFPSTETNNSIEAKYYSCNITKSFNEATDDEEASIKSEASCNMNDDERHEEDEKFFQSDINTKLREILEQLSGLEKNLRERKRKMNRSLCAALLSIFCSCLQLFS